MTGATLDVLLREAAERPFAGWDVSYGGRISSRCPWDFRAIVAGHLESASSLLDLDTGGGEWLSRFPNLPARTVAVEAWLPNVEFARSRLSPLGVEVHGVPSIPWNSEQRDGLADRYLPFGDASFDLVTSRHGSYIAAELARVLRPGGLFLTQQVGSGASDGYYRLLDEDPPSTARKWDLATGLRQLERAGFVVEEADEAYEEVTFEDVGALAWYLENLPFICPGFSIERARSRLAQLYAAREPLQVRLPSFWMKARRP